MRDGNRTIDPAHKATAATQLGIEQVRSCKSGRLIDVRDFIERQSYAGFIQCRALVKAGIHRGRPRFICSSCNTPVYLVAHTVKTFYFRHTIEDGSCPAQTRSPFSREQINAMKYLGARESDAHKRMKGLLARSLNADAAVTDVKIEETWRSESTPSAYKRPDVQARFGDIRLALEVQLSTTFLDVVVSRREFYRDDKAMLLWVMRRFNPEYRRLTEDDILFNNNANILVVDDETTKLSEERGITHIRCFCWEPYLDGESLEHKWSEHICRLNELTLDVAGQRAYLFDVAGYRQALRKQQAELRIERQRATEEMVRQRFYAFCDNWTEYKDPEDVETAWEGLAEALAMFGVTMPSYLNLDGKFRSLILALTSIKLGRPVGFQFKKLVEVLHTIAERHKDLIWHVGWALKAYDRKALIAEEDRHGKWSRREGRIAEAMRAKHPDYQPYNRWDAAVRFLFPELAPRLNLRAGSAAADKPDIIPSEQHIAAHSSHEIVDRL